jgi:hypothetical protein
LFIEQWNWYKRSSGEADADKLRDQLMYCPDEALRKHVSKSLGDTDADTITEKLAVERQSNLINTVALMSASQERDEGIHQNYQ